jgi:hypothetical protein
LEKALAERVEFERTIRIVVLSPTINVHGLRHLAPRVREPRLAICAAGVGFSLFIFEILRPVAPCGWGPLLLEDGIPPWG